MEKSPNLSVKLLTIASTYPSPTRRHTAPFIHHRAKQLAQCGLEVRVFTRNHITFGTYFSNPSRIFDFFSRSKDFFYDLDGITVYGFRVHMGMPLNYSRGAVALTHRKIKPRLKALRNIYPFNIFQMATWGDLSLAAARFSADIGIPYIASAIGGYENRYYNRPGSIPYGIMQELFGGAALVVCVSEDLKQKVLKMTNGAAKAVTFYSGVDTKRFCPSPSLRSAIRSKLNLGEDDVLITNSARLVAEKGIYDLLEAFAAIRSHAGRVKLLLLGMQPERRRISRVIRRLDIASDVTILGAIDPSEVQAYLAASDIFAFPSWMEGLPNSIMEACSCGLSVIASNVGGIPEIIEDGVSGILIQPRNREQLSSKMIQLVRTGTWRQFLGNNARQRMIEKFNYEKNGLYLADAIGEIVAYNRRKTRFELLT